MLAEVSVVAGTIIHSTSAKSAGTRQALVPVFQPRCVPLGGITSCACAVFACDDHANSKRAKEQRMSVMI
jgi:hypothetical protein